MRSSAGCCAGGRGWNREGGPRDGTGCRRATRAGAPPVAGTIRLEGVSKIFNVRGKETHALGKTDLEIRRSEFVSLVGPSGCGKSTILNLVAGLLDAHRGRGVLRRRAAARAQRPRGLHDAEGHAAALAHRRGQHRGPARASLPRRAARRDPRARRGDHEAGGPDRLREALSGRALRRHAQAGRAGPDADLRARDAADGRAVRRAGRAAQAADARPAAAADAAAAHDRRCSSPTTWPRPSRSPTAWW